MSDPKRDSLDRVDLAVRGIIKPEELSDSERLAYKQIVAHRDNGDPSRRIEPAKYQRASKKIIP